MTEEQWEMIKEFQCPGCGCGGPDPKECSAFTLQEDTWINGAKWSICQEQSPGTVIAGLGPIYLGMPKGFSRMGHTQNFLNTDESPTRIYLFEDMPTYDKFNIATWAMIKNGYLFVRVYSPRVNLTYTHVIKLKDSEEVQLPRGAYDVSKFYDEID